VVEVRVVNWRCIENVEIRLGRFNVFVGGNSTGKSSLAYAVYLASRSSREADPVLALTKLYGRNLGNVFRRDGNNVYSPTKISLDGNELVLEKSGKDDKEVKVTRRPLESPWAYEYLLPSRRIGYLHMLFLIRNLLQTPLEKDVDGASVRLLASFTNLLSELIVSVLSVSPPFGAFAEDYLSS
jgi:hypothetical protein